MTKTQILQRALLGTALAMPLAACGGGGSTSASTPATPPVVAQTAQEDKFGLPFGKDFRADPNTDPTPVSDGDIVAVSLTDDPIPIN